MTKSELISRLADRLSIPKQTAETVVESVIDSMRDALKRGERIEIRGLGSFEVRNYRAYEGRNPKTGERVAVRPKRLPFFKVGKELRERLNAARDDEPRPRGALQAGALRPTPTLP